MNFLLPIFAAFLEAGADALDKTILSVRRVDFRSYLGISFPLSFFILLIVFFIFRPPLLENALYANNLWILLVLSISISIGNNFFWYRALKYDGLGEMETFSTLSSLPIIIFASIIFADERNFYILIPALVAVSAIMWSHWDRRHFKIARFTGIYLLWSIFVTPIGEVILKTLLQTWNPISLDMIRSASIALVLAPFYYKYDTKVSLNNFGLLILTNILTTGGWLLYFFSYKYSGIVYTVLLYSLQPLLAYFAALILLKERINRKKIFAFFIVLVAIIIAQFMG